jgi:hypothetical protein
MHRPTSAVSSRSAVAASSSRYTPAPTAADGYTPSPRQSSAKPSSGAGAVRAVDSHNGHSNSTGNGHSNSTGSSSSDAKKLDNGSKSTGTGTGTVKKEDINQIVDQLLGDDWLKKRDVGKSQLDRRTKASWSANDSVFDSQKRKLPQP